MFFKLINDEIRARENCTVPKSNSSEPQEHFKGNRYREVKGRFYDTNDGILVQVCMNRLILRKFCVCIVNKNHWSDKCQTITNSNACKDFLKNSNRCFICLKENHKLKESKKPSHFFTAKGNAVR